MLPSELTIPVFTDIAFGNRHWRRISLRGEGAGCGGPASKDPMIQGKTYFCIIFFQDLTKKLTAGVFSRGGPRTS